MPIGSRIVTFPCLFLLALLSHGAFGIACAADPVLPRVVIRHHELFVQIVPEQHALIAKDRLTLEVPQQKPPIRFSLAPTLQIDRIVLVQESAGTESLIHDVPFELERGPTPESAQQIMIPPQVVAAGLVTLDVHYHGVINDPPRDPRHLRFVTPSETAGHIGAGRRLYKQRKLLVSRCPGIAQHLCAAGCRAGGVDCGNPREGW